MISYDLFDSNVDWIIVKQAMYHRSLMLSLFHLRICG